MHHRFRIVGIGELLWDVFPDGRRLGGAPVNFACHCNQLGAEAWPVICLGGDELGAEAREVLTTLKVDHSRVAEDAAHPTGTVQVTLDDEGKPSYEICEDVAWDVIPMSTDLVELAGETDAACFGSLAQRGEVSRSTIHAFLDAMRPDAVRIFDVNLRQTFYSKGVIERSLDHANVLKLSDEELPILADLFDLAGSVRNQLGRLVSQFDLQAIACTRGAEGSLLMTPDNTDAHPGHPADVVDSVGAGDSFTAAMCIGLLHDHPLAQINDHANRVAAFVCSQKGATPLIPDELRSGSNE